MLTLTVFSTELSEVQAPHTVPPPPPSRGCHLLARAVSNIRRNFFTRALKLSGGKSSAKIREGTSCCRIVVRDFAMGVHSR